MYLESISTTVAMKYQPSIVLACRTDGKSGQAALIDELEEVSGFLVDRGPAP